MKLRKEAIDVALGELAEALGKVREPVDLRHPELRTHYAASDYAAMVRVVRDHMRLPLRLRVGIVNKDDQGLLGAPAWIDLRVPMPVYGSPAFRNLVLDVFFRRSFLETRPFETVVMAIAHELSHIVTSSIQHRLQRYEEATDLTAMYLGYRHFYVTGVVYEVRPREQERGFWERIENLLHGTNATMHRFGYLSQEEVEYANSVIEKIASRQS